MAPTACRRVVSGSLSLPCPGCFSPFPHGTRALSVSRECLALPDGPGCFRQDSSCPALLRIPIGFRSISRTGLSPSAAALSNAFRYGAFFPSLGPTTPRTPKRPWFGLCRFRSPLLAVSLLFSFPAGTKMFQFPALASFQRMSELHSDGFPHSGTRGSCRICRSPRTFAACRALLRLREPRHPPRALLFFPGSRGTETATRDSSLVFVIVLSFQSANDLFPRGE